VQDTWIRYATANVAPDSPHAYLSGDARAATHERNRARRSER
jgi:hypothetical protein